MRKEYSIPEMEKILLHTQEVITTSSFVDDPLQNEGEEEDW